MISLTPHQKEALRFDAHTSLTANAGSGKTFVLSKRFLEIATTQNISLRNIAAITFTDKAASELYNKIANEINKRISGTTDKEELRKLERLRRGLVSANISTIHSFCIDILKEHPVEAGLDANFIPIDQQLSEELIELSVEEIIRESFGDENDEKVIKNLIRVFSSKGVLAGEITSLIKNRKNILLLKEKIYDNPVDEIAKFFYKEFLKKVDAIFFEDPNQFLTPLKKINNEVLAVNKGNEKAVNAESIIKKIENENNVEENIKLISELNDTICKKSGGGGLYIQGYLKNIEADLLSDEIEKVNNYLSDFKKIEIDENHKQTEKELAEFGKKIIYIFTRADERYTLKKRENGYLDYEDILILTRNILKNPDVQNKLSMKYKYLMIDEYQDTNEIQYQIFLPILQDLKQGNLFVVGDEKQSIYMFRDAELEVFNRTKKDIENSSGIENILSLPDTFRMAPNLCGFTNYLFKGLFKSPNLIFNEVEYSEIVCARNDEIEGSVEILIPDDEQENLSESELVARKILKLVNNEKEKNINWGDVAILCRKRKSFDELESIFIKYGIPYIIIGGKGFYQRQSIYDIYNYFSFLLDKNNDTALVGILRSPFFTISDAKIFEISLLNGETFFEKLLKYSKKNLEFKNIVTKLNENLLLANNFDIVYILRKILKETEYLSVISSRVNSKQELANIDKLIKVTANFNQQGFKNLYDYVTYLKDAIEQTQDESQAAVAEESNAVKIMTLHQAKGLEYPAVFLYKSNEKSQKQITKSKAVTVDKEFGLLTKLPPGENYFEDYLKAPIIGISDLINEKKNIAEIKRLFYVGVTRAKNYLFISSEYQKELNFNFESFMGLLQSSQNISLSEDFFSIKTNLKYLIQEKGKYSNIEKQIKIEIPVIRNIEEIGKSEELIEEIYFPELLINEIKDQPRGEIISATKVAVYKQCPLKYRLTYELGFSPLMREFKSLDRKENLTIKIFEFNSKENRILTDDGESDSNSRNFSDVKGRIIHKILEEEIELKDLSDFVDKEIVREISLLDFDETSATLLKKDIWFDIEKFYKSGIYKELKTYSNYKNELEIYTKENDYFLYGIIDKLVIDEDSIKIVDYKTDDIEKSKLLDRSLSYFNQLKFYSYIANHLFTNLNNIELNLIFIKFPDDIFKQNVSGTDLEGIKKDIEDMVKKIREGIFEKNHKHCTDCFFSPDQTNCIIN